MPRSSGMTLHQQIPISLKVYKMNLQIHVTVDFYQSDGSRNYDLILENLNVEYFTPDEDILLLYLFLMPCGRINYHGRC
jgi:hypothetical protein